MKSKLAILIHLGLVFGIWAQAQNLAEREIGKIPQMLKLGKVTVGPYDNYQGDTDSHENFLLFTRKMEMVPLLYVQNLRTGQVQTFLDSVSDAQEARLSPSGALVAFVLYKRVARGELCWQGAAMRGLHFECVPAGEGEVSSPFWLGERKLGYVARAVGETVGEIRAYDLDRRKETVLFKGAVWSPTASRDGNWLTFVIGAGATAGDNTPAQQRGLALWDMRTQQLHVLEVDVPGISGFPSFSVDGKVLFFTQYTSDTNGDQSLDANDHGVIFRIPLAKAIDAGRTKRTILPEQLTSADTNCSFPRPQRDYMYVTCGFEGSLDIYRLPLSGLVPEAWAESRLWNAHQSSRSYWQRVLLLNTLRYRLGKVQDLELQERLLSDHLYAQDLEATLFYIQKLQGSAGSSSRVLPVIGSFLRSQQELRNPGAEPLAQDARKKLTAQLRDLARPPLSQADPSGRQILRIWLESYLHGIPSARKLWQQTQFASSQGWPPLTDYLYFAVAQRVLPQNQWDEAWMRVYAQLVDGPSLSEDSHIYYGYRFLSALQEMAVSPQDRLRQIAGLKGRIQSPVVKTLLDSETVVLTLVQKKDAAEKRKVYTDLDKLMAQTRAQYSLRRALYVRAIVNFADFDEVEYLNVVAANWLKYTQKDDTEFYYARDHFAEVVTARAYFHLAEKQDIMAAGLFYNGLTLADDLESHYGFIKVKLALGEREGMLQSYENLQKLGVVSDSRPYIDAAIVVAGEPIGTSKAQSALKQAAGLLEGMKTRVNDPIRHLLLGGVYVGEALAQEPVPGDLVEKAHYHLMLAYDLGRERVRIRVAALTNLALLHQHAGNHGLANKFFSLRKPLPYLHWQQRVQMAVLSSRSLFYVSAFAEAARELEEILNAPEMRKHHLTGTWPLMLKERWAFYLSYAQDYARAATVYKDLMANSPPLPSGVLAKIYLNYGRSLFYQGNKDEALKNLQRAVAEVTSLGQKDANWVGIRGQRIQALAYGYMAQSAPLEQAKGYYELRGAILQGAEKNLQQWRLRQEDWLEFMALNQSHLAQLARQQGNILQAKEALLLSWDYLQRWVELKKNHLSSGLYQTQINLMVLMAESPASFADYKWEPAQAALEQMIRSYRAVPGRSPMLKWRELKLRVHQAAARYKLGLGERAEALKVMESEEAVQVKAALPTAYQELSRWLADL